MPSVNIYKIVADKRNEFFSYLDKVYDFLFECNEKMGDEESEPTVYLARLYYLEKDSPSNLKWNWVFSMFGQEGKQSYGAPKGVVTLSSKANCYALTFGHSFFHVDKYSDKDWPFSFARTLTYSNIKTTALTNPHSQRNKTVNTYLRYEELEFDSGEALAKLKAKIILEDGFSLFTENIEIGNSIKLTVKNPVSINKITQIVEHIENDVLNAPVQVKIPFFRKIKDKVQSDQLKADLSMEIEKNIGVIDFSGYQIFATQIIFSEDYDYCYQFDIHDANVENLGIDFLLEFIKTFKVPPQDVLNISVCACEDGVKKFETKIENLVFYTNDHQKALLMDGEWYRYNEDF